MNSGCTFIIKFPFLYSFKWCPLNWFPCLSALWWWNAYMQRNWHLTFIDLLSSSEIKDIKNTLPKLGFFLRNLCLCILKFQSAWDLATVQRDRRCFFLYSFANYHTQNISFNDEFSILHSNVDDNVSVCIIFFYPCIWQCCAYSFSQPNQSGDHIMIIRIKNLFFHGFWCA